LIEKYDLDGMGEQLEYEWLGENGDRHSLRDLADEFNQRLLRRTLENAGRNPLDGEVENLYRLLTADEVSSGERTRARRTLDRDGVDIERLKSDFVSHQAVHTYLTKGRGVSRPEEPSANKIEKDAVTIQKLRNKLVAVTSRSLENLSETDRIAGDSFTVTVDVRVTCGRCNTVYSIDDLLSNEGCYCD
jgi:hypothetical protein